MLLRLSESENLQSHQEFFEAVLFVQQCFELKSSISMQNLKSDNTNMTLFRGYFYVIAQFVGMLTSTVEYRKCFLLNERCAVRKLSHVLETNNSGEFLKPLCLSEYVGVLAGSAEYFL